ncbi:nucleoside/nucleotide kinase family protein [Paracoccaceae bacterium Fryx2]|nr:nucleoside/nucleotide kinase family protein [Paracoccaceae bacterium Fryx2]
MTPETLAADIRARATGRARFIAAVAGPPGAGKSTLAGALVAALGPGARLVPMDGFHYDNAVLDARGLRARKGAPETFDAAGFCALLHRLRDGGAEIAIPVFDRAADLARAGADVITDADRILIVEGNYLLLDAAPWSAARPLYDLTIFLDVPEAELERRLVRRWRDHGLAPDAARARALSNDIPNARLVLSHSHPATIQLRQG